MPSTQPAFQWSSASLLSLESGALLIPVFKPAVDPEKSKEEEADDIPVTPSDLGLTELDEALNGALTTVLAQEGFDGSKGKTLLLRPAPGGALKTQAVVLFGLGSTKKISPLRVEQGVNKALSVVASWKGLETAAVQLPAVQEKLTETQSTIAIVDGVYQALYKSAEAKKPAPDFKTITLLVADVASSHHEHALETGIALAASRSFAKDLVNRPSNLKTTQTMVDAAKSLTGMPGITVKIIDDVEWIQKEMPCFYEVAKGSVTSDPPRFISVSYQPGKADGINKRLAIVGKTVIFDTGGYQVKPDNYMCTMKADMTGGAMVLGTMKAIATLQPQHVAVTAYLAATPNKIDSDAMLPDTIVDTTVGKKVEIRHTDAEGRLTLIDVVAKAAGAHEAPEKPDALLTIATLTGSAARAVGLCVALMANDAAVETGLDSQVLDAARSLGEPFQQLQVIEEDYEDIKSKLDGADIINTTQNKNRGAQSAAAFVMSGAPDTLPMVHLDIAGADMTSDEKATGIGQKTLIQWVLSV